METQQSAALVVVVVVVVVVVALVLLALTLALLVLLPRAFAAFILLALAFAALVFLAVGHEKTPVIEWEKMAATGSAAAEGTYVSIAVDARASALFALVVVSFSSKPEDQVARGNRVEAAVAFLRR